MLILPTETVTSRCRKPEMFRPAPANYSQYYGGGRPRGYSQPAPYTPASEYLLSPPQPHARHRAPVASSARARRRGPPGFPVEMWEKVISHLPRREQAKCLRVCRMFNALALRFLLSTINVHLEQRYCYFDKGGQWNFRWGPDEGTLIETSYAGNCLLAKIAQDPSWARHVKKMVLFIEDEHDYKYVQYVEPALRALPHLESFKLIVTYWMGTDMPERQGTAKWLIPTVSRHCRQLQEILVPNGSSWAVTGCLHTLRNLRKLVCRARLGLDMQIPDPDARNFVESAAKLKRTFSPGVYLGGGLTSLSIDWLIFDIIPHEVLRWMVELELYNMDDCRKMYKRLAGYCSALKSLTIYDYRTYSDGALPVPGLQLEPDDADLGWQNNYVPQPQGENTLTTLTPQTGHGARDPLNKLTSFKWVAYRDVLSPYVCKDLTKFLEGRCNLRRVDIKAVIYDKESAKMVLHALNKMQYLEVLGFEFRDTRCALKSGLELLGRIPRTVTHLKYHVVGWDLKAKFTTADDVVRRALDKLPRLKFLYLYDGILRDSHEDYIRLASPYPHFDFKSLRFLGLECLFLDINHDTRGWPVVNQWPPRLTLWSSFEAPERLGEDGEWLIRYNRDIEDLST